MFKKMSFVQLIVCVRSVKKTHWRLALNVGCIIIPNRGSIVDKLDSKNRQAFEELPQIKDYSKL